MGRPKNNIQEKVVELKIQSNDVVIDINTEEVKEVKPASINGPGVKCDAVEPGSRAEKQLIYFASCPKVSTRILRRDGEKPGAFETVIVNNLRINILKGVPVLLPAPVVAIIDDAFYRTDQAINNTSVRDPFSGSSKPLAVDQQNNSDGY